MDLVNLTLKNFRRFSPEETLELNESLIALVGPNEAGKTSLLYALELVGSMRGGSPNRPSFSDVTRGTRGTASLEAFFVLEDADKAAIEHIHGADAVRSVEITVDSAGGYHWLIQPYPRRDLGPRKAVLAQLDMLDGDPALDPQHSTTEDRPWDPARLETVRTLLGSENDSLTSGEIAELDELAVRIELIEYPPRAEGDDEPEVSEEVREREASRDQVVAALRALAQTERQPAPWTQVEEVLRERLPEVVQFGGEDRELRSEYVVAEVADNPPAALRNLCELAKVDLAEVNTLVGAGDRGAVEHIFENANTRLKDRFQHTWSQSDVYPRLTPPHEGIIRVFVAVEDEAGYSEPAERSDGLRWFMALHAFLVAQRQTNPIVLVDEAETHLHYDAQADLIDALMSQDIAQKFIYTTHSVGCLPPDLGCGIRVVLPDGATERSHICNSYWSVEPWPEMRAGYTPLLFAMGARLLSLTVPRFGVVGEGPSEAILLPSLFRVATGEKSLPYRVVAGISEVDPIDVPELVGHAWKTTFIVDGDQGGADNAEKLQKGGVPKEDIFSLSDVAEGCTLEDLVSADVFASAINSEIETWGLGPLRVDPADVPATGRWLWLGERASESGTDVESLRKQRVAQRMVDAIRAAKLAGGNLTDLLAVGIADRLRDLHQRICVALEVPGVPKAR